MANLMMTDMKEALPDEHALFVDWLSQMLKEMPVTVTFIKKDGTERTMKCTLNPNLIPQQPLLEETKEKKKKAVNENVMAVFDLEINAWRSFTTRSVIGVNFNLND
jgi:WYL_2, Sm-like SH3 beta-barrel fold